MRIAPEVAEALAGGPPVVALESTLISHGLPRPRNLAVAHEVEAEVRAAGAVPGDDRGGRRARLASGWTRPALEAIAAARRRRQVRGARPGRGGRARRSRCDHGGGHGVAGRARGHRGSSPPAGSAACTARRARPGTSRPTSRPWRARGITVVCSGVKSILDVGATLERLETLGVTVLGYGTDASPASTSPTRATPCPGAWTRPAEVAAVLARAARARHRRARSWWPTRCRWPSSSTRRCTTACSRRGLAAAAARGVSGKEVTPVPARLLPPRDRRARAWRRTCGSCCATRARRADRGRRGGR